MYVVYIISPRVEAPQGTGCCNTKCSNAKIFQNLSFRQLLFKDRVFSTRSQFLCSKHISDSSKSSQSQIDFFFLAFFPFTLASKVNSTTMISPPSRHLMKALWQHYCLEEDFPLRWISPNSREQLCRASPGHQDRAEPGRIPFNHAPQVSCC